MNRLVSRSLVVALIFCFSFTAVVYGAGSATTFSPTAGVWDLILDTWNALSTLWQEESTNEPVPPDTSTSNSDAGSSVESRIIS